MRQRRLTRTVLLAIIALQVSLDATSTQAQSAGLAPLPVIVDDDGSADGMVGLLCLLQNPTFEVKAVTIAQGLAHPDIFAPLAVRMLKRLGCEGIPVAAGRLSPLEGSNAFPESWRADTDSFWEIDLPEGENGVSALSAAELIVQVVKRSAEPVTILATGPLTNVAEALRVEPGIATNIRLVEIMGGAVRAPGNVGREWPAIDNTAAEWNIWVDPVAADEVLSAGFPTALVPLEVTNRVKFTAEDAAAWRAAGTEEGELAAEFVEYLLGQIGSEEVSVWDAVAAVDLCDPSLCTASQVRIDVLTEPGREEGRTVARGDGEQTCRLCRRPKTEKIKAYLGELLSRE